MPLFALMLNLGWEAIYAILGMRDWNKGETMAHANCIVNSVWFFTDILILFLYIRNGSKLFINFTTNHKENKILNLTYVFIVFLVCVGTQIAFYYEFKDNGTPHYTDGNVILEYGMAGVYSAFIQNAIMSVLFFMVFYMRRDLSGQNMTLGILKFVGTLCPSILYGLIYGIDPLVICMGIICATFDIGYIVKTIKIKAYYNSNPKFIVER